MTPSNLPADICDTPGATDLNVPAETTTTIDPNAPCDLLVPQADGLPSICVHKYANANIAGSLLLKAHVGAPRPPTIAIVATNGFAVDTGAIVDAQGDYLEDPMNGREGPGASDPRGEPANFGGGAGHVTPGAGVGEGSSGGSAFGPTTGTQLVAGSTGATGFSAGLQPPGMAGRAGGAVQLVSCGELRLSGSVTTSGQHGFDGMESVNSPSGGGGGGSGGTLVVEALSITGSTGKLSATGGAGGTGGMLFSETGPSTPGGEGGTGGTGSAAPTPGKTGDCPPTSFCSGAGGGGGAVGRIVINVPHGASVPAAITIAPPASVGVAGTH